MWWSPTLEKMFQEMLQNRSRITLKDCKPIIRKQRQYRAKIYLYLTNSDSWTRIEPYKGLNHRCAAIIALCPMFAEHFTSKVGIRLPLVKILWLIVSLEICSTYLCMYENPTPNPKICFLVLASLPSSYWFPKQYIHASSARKQLPQNSCEWQVEDDLYKHLPSTAKLFCEGGKITTIIDNIDCSKIIIIII